MKAILEFDLPGDNEEFEQTQRVSKYFCSLWDLNQFLRSKLKYEELTDEEFKAYNSLQKKLWEILDEHGISDEF